MNVDGSSDIGSAGPTDLLREEHRRILEVVAVLDRLVEIVQETGEIDRASFRQCVIFFKLFADACHHGKEEDLLFPELVAHGFSTETGPIAVMLEEHRRGRAFVRDMDEALGLLEQGGSENPDALLEGARGYSHLIRGHIGKEDGVLFEMADQIVRGPPCRTLCTSYESVECGKFDGHTKAQLESLAAALQGRYPKT